MVYRIARVRLMANMLGFTEPTQPDSKAYWRTRLISETVALKSEYGEAGAALGAGGVPSSAGFRAARPGKRPA